MRYERLVLPVSKLPKDRQFGDEFLLIDNSAKNPVWKLCLWAGEGWFVGNMDDMEDYTRQLEAEGEGYAEWFEMPTHFTVLPPKPLPVTQTKRQQ